MSIERASKRQKVSASASKLPGFTRWNLEEDYEKRNRKSRKQDGHQRLPFKTAGGQVVAQPEEVTTIVTGDNDSDDISEADSGVADVDLPQTKPLEPQLSHKEEVLRAKEELARIAEFLSENPEEHIGSLQTLRDLAASRNVVVKKLALGTQLAVYKDIIPGYRIRPLSKDDLNAKVSKDVKKLRTFEQGLLNGYSGFVKTLATLAKDRTSTKPGEISLADIAISCVCALIRDVSHFNFRNDLIDILTDQLGRSRYDRRGILSRITSAIEAVFDDDDDGHTSLEIVSRVTAMMKDKKYQVHESVLNTFLHLRLLNEFRGKASTERVHDAAEDDVTDDIKQKHFKKEFRTKRERKRLREVKAVEKEMKEADAAVSHEERDKNQGATLKIIFVTYFRILKARTPHLTGAVLEGLARYAHLINQDFFGDVLEVLRELIVEVSLRSDQGDGDNDDDDLEDSIAHLARSATRESLLCTTTAFAMLQGQSDVMKSAGQLQLDLSFFTTHLFRSLPEFAMDADIELSEKSAHLQDPNGLATPAAETKVNVATTVVLLMRSLSATLLPPTNTRSVPPARVAAFTKQLLTIATHLPAKSTYAVLGLLQTIAKTHGLKIAALWNTDERRGDGVYNAHSEEAEASNPFAATAWEGELLKHHFDPKVRESHKLLERSIRDAAK